MDNNLKKQIEHFKMTSTKEVIEAAKALSDGSIEALKAVIQKVSNSKIVASIAATIQSAPAKADELKRYITSSIPSKFVPMITEIYALAVGIGLFFTGALMLELLGVVLVLWALSKILPTIIETSLDKIQGMAKSLI